MGRLRQCQVPRQYVGVIGSRISLSPQDVIDVVSGWLRQGGAKSHNTETGRYLNCILCRLSWSLTHGRAGVGTAWTGWQSGTNQALGPHKRLAEVGCRGVQLPVLTASKPTGSSFILSHSVDGFAPGRN